uniref:Vint domain-containing protein n=1 Tax=viral metagenome TaxID=1070528 RepID=A0A6C0LBP5_9ZZZZ
MDANNIKPDDILNSSKKINEMYKHIGYFDEYGGSLLLFILLTILLFIGHSYSVVMMNIKPLQENWPVERCNPKVIPFAGFINKPSNMSINEYTNQNFQYCLQDILTNITGYAVQPITYTTALLQSGVSGLMKAIDFINVMMANIRTNMGSMAQNTMSRIANILVPLQRIMVMFKDVMEKIKGIFASTLYTSLGTYYALQSFMGAIGELLIIILIVLAVLIMGFWIVPFTWPFAITMTTIFVSVSIPLAIMLVFMKEVLQVNIDLKLPSVPSKPNMCFDPNTLLKMEDGSTKKILDIRVGDILEKNNIVTAKLVLDATNVKMYNLHNVIVSGCHPVKHDYLWIPVSNHPDAKPIEPYLEPFIYCLNTSNKVIIIHDTHFSDWDEVYQKEMNCLKRVTREKYGDKSLVHENNAWIHTYLDGGFASHTLVTLQNEQKVCISDICIGDVLEQGEIVRGIVEIDGKLLLAQYRYNLGKKREGKGKEDHEDQDEENCIIEGGPNLRFYGTLENEYFRETIPKKEILYHLLTDTGTFSIQHLVFCHYNSTLELFLE